MNQQHLDLVTLVDEKDHVIGELDKVEAHKGDAKRHRAISVYLFRNTETGKELLMQQRSQQKIVGANQWANTVCGNVRPTENYEECAYRRLREELGIVQVNIKPIYKFEYHLRCNEQFSEWEMDQVFTGNYDGEVNPNPDEVQDFTYVKWQELLEKTAKAKLKSEEYNTKLIELESSNNRITLAPWFVKMLHDHHLLKKIDMHSSAKKGVS